VAVPQAFTGARVAADYEEDAHTMHGDELAAWRASHRAVAAFEANVPAAAAAAPADAPADTYVSTARGDVPLDVPAPTVATRGLRGALSRIGLRMPPGAIEAAELAAAASLARHEQTIRQTTWLRAVAILVANPKGGVGKTPAALLLGGTLAAVRGGSVAVVEVTDDAGSLALRAEGTPPRGLAELLASVDDIRSAGQISGYTAPQTSFAAVIGSPRRRHRLDGRHVRALADVLDGYYGIRIMDSGNSTTSSAFVAAVDAADALVVPVVDAPDAAAAAAAMIETMRSAGGRSAELAESAVVLRMVDGRPTSPAAAASSRQILAASGLRQVIDIPFDDHIASNGPLSIASLSPATRAAFTAAAAAVISPIRTN